MNPGWMFWIGSASPFSILKAWQMRKNGGKILKKAGMPELDLLILKIPVRTPLSLMPCKRAAAEDTAI